METFEIHITSDDRIHDRAKRLGHKTIEIANLRPDRSVMYIEHMTSIVEKFENYEKCKDFVLQLAPYYSPIRVKIECPPYIHYDRELIVVQSLYTSHNFQTFPR